MYAREPIVCLIYEQICLSSIVCFGVLEIKNIATWLSGLFIPSFLSFKKKIWIKQALYQLYIKLLKIIHNVKTNNEKHLFNLLSYYLYLTQLWLLTDLLALCNYSNDWKEENLLHLQIKRLYFHCFLQLENCGFQHSSLS